MKSIELYFCALNSNCRAVLIEGLNETEYEEHVKALKKIIISNEGVNLDFNELMGKQYIELLKIHLPEEILFIYGLDLFGNEIDPNKATDAMRFLRSRGTERNFRELMIARPNANLDYNSRKGFGYYDNHPLGNWCDFFRIKDGKLERDIYPIKQKLG
jgi:hypothetical protein